MNVLENMRRRMQPLKIYNLNQEGSLADAELAACAQVLEEAYQSLQDTEREMFLASAQDWGLENKCALLGTADGKEQKRPAALELLRENGQPCTQTVFQRLADSVGCSGNLYECCAENQVVLCPDFPPKESGFALRILRRMLPAHLQGVLDMRGKQATWQEWDGNNAAWFARDAQKKSWRESENDVIIF